MKGTLDFTPEGLWRVQVGPQSRDFEKFVDAQAYLDGNGSIDVMNLKEFLSRPGINVSGLCKESGVLQPYLARCLSEKKLPGKKAMQKLLPVMQKYGWK